VDDRPQQDTSAAAPELNGAAAPRRVASPLAGRAPRRRWWRRHPWLALSGLAGVLLLVAFVGLQIAMAGRVDPGVEVAGVEVGGLSVPAAEDALEEELVPAVRAVTLRTDDEPLSLTLDGLGISVDVPATARAARAHGRHDLPLGLSVWLPFGGDDPAPVVRVDVDAYESGLEAVRAAVDVPSRDATLDLEGREVTVVAGKDGVTVDAIGLERAILTAVAEGRAYAGGIPVTGVPPEVGPDEAEERAGAAAIYLSRPITLRLRERSLELAPAEMAGMLTVNKGSDADLYPLTFDNPEARQRLHELFAYAETLPQDAEIVVHEEGGITVLPSRDGIVLDMARLADDLNAAASGGGLRQVVVALRPALPDLSSEDVRSMGLSALGSQFTTYFNLENPGRATNIALAAKLVDGTIVQPGAVFSLNATMGPRTTNRGFDFAPVIAGDGVLRQGVGGGICQYATTLFNAVFFAGLPVVERHAHGLLIAHYPMGRDATVSWGGPDFKFKNDTAQAVMIRSWVEGAALTVAIVGKTGREVDHTTSDYYDIRKPSSSRADPRVVFDDDLPNGVTRWELGADGKSVKVVRTVRDAAGEVLFRETYVSVYDPRDWIKRVGTGT
jgi:vancomycin resistance protein YoaR